MATFIVRSTKSNCCSKFALCKHFNVNLQSKGARHIQTQHAALQEIKSQQFVGVVIFHLVSPILKTLGPDAHCIVYDICDKCVTRM